MPEKSAKILGYLQEHQQEIQRDLTELVQADSLTADRDRVVTCSQKLQEIFRHRLALEPDRTYPQEKYGPHLSYRLGRGEKRLMLVGHYDTVWPKGKLELRQEGDLLYGPGTLDMKSGVISGIWALKALKELELFPEKEIDYFLNSDEEANSPTSAPVIMEHAKGCEAAVILEPAEAVTGAIKTGRKGLINYTITAHGKASHTGNDPQGGVNAIEEIARQIIWLHSLTDYEVGTVVTVGIVNGGVSTAIIPDFAQIKVDIRCLTVAESRRICQVVEQMKPILPGIRLEIEGGVIKEPLEATPWMFERLREAAEPLGLNLEQTIAGGTSDGNFTYQAGVPTIDGLGATGEGLHALHEHLYLKEYLPRIALLANYLTML